MFLVLQIMNGFCQLSQSTRLDRVFSLLEVYYRAPGNSRLARKQLIRKLLRFCPHLIQVFCVDYSFVLAASLIRQVQRSRVSQHRRIGAARPARRCLFADVMELARNDMPAREQADCSTCAYAAVGSAKLAFGSGQDVIDFIFHRPQREPARRLRQSR